MIVCSGVFFVHRGVLLGDIQSILLFPNQGINLRNADGVYYFPLHLSLHQLNIFENILDLIRDSLIKKNGVLKCSSQKKSKLYMLLAHPFIPHRTTEIISGQNISMEKSIYKIPCKIFFYEIF